MVFSPVEFNEGVGSVYHFRLKAPPLCLCSAQMRTTLLAVISLKFLSFFLQSTDLIQADVGRYFRGKQQD